ncbi:xylulokinase [Robiginitalea marina]|uniref:FGGY family carbohydrate kinase n=1 Tax=Robiginitalea marina TaxID=2954105 RepID=A0ABT1AX27_9FLAO|nr:FGGY family carbohydrate kinase [Robiginitalea marina]MCO5724600.1 FGGY family carbohydrate kinase [Robiginitalea marina]
MYFIGYDLGSSSLKTALVSAADGRVVDVVKTPEEEMEIAAPRAGWAEQDPAHWWDCLCRGTREVLGRNGIAGGQVSGIGIAYQMHGLVPLDAQGHPVRPSIIWCDSRAVGVGQEALAALGGETCRTRLLNDPGNFTGSKLRWMKEQEPEAFARTKTFLLPGDYLAFRLSGALQTTASGLSEGILWDFRAGEPAWWLLDHWGIPRGLVPEIVPTFGQQARVSKQGAAATGLAEGTPICYRAGDQPNNALTLNVFNPGEIAATAGTSGVLYGVSDRTGVGEISKFNNFAHVNHSPGHPRIGQLLCINGAGSLYRWLKKQLGPISYGEMNRMASEVPPGSEGVWCLPFGNGAERMLGNRTLEASFSGIDLNRHHRGHLCRAALEGIAFAFRYGMEWMEKDGVAFREVRAGSDNLFQASAFTETLATLGNIPIALFRVTGAVGAARACIVHEKGPDLLREWSASQDYEQTIRPSGDSHALRAAYTLWKNELEKHLKP